MAGVVEHGVRTELRAPLEVARWRPLVHWLLAVPHFAILYAVGAVAGVLVVIAWFAILFTGRIPDGIVRFLAMYLRYTWRVMSYAGALYEPYPPFEYDLAVDDDDGSPAVFELEPPDELSRGLIFVKWLLVIPHAFALFFVYIGAFFAYAAGALAVIFTGAWPAGIRDYLVGVARWTNRVNAYTYLLTDEYPPFSLQ